MTLRRIFSLLLALVLVASPIMEALPAVAYAEETAVTETAETEATTESTEETTEETTEVTEETTEVTEETTEVTEETTEVTEETTEVTEETTEVTEETTEVTEETTEVTEETTEVTEETTEVTEETTEVTEETTEVTEETQALLEEEEENVERFLIREIPDDFEAPIASLADAGIMASTQLPSSYDTRDHYTLPTARNQGSYGLCWSFASMAMAESYMITHDKGTGSMDLSERHLGHFFTGDAYDPLGYGNGDGSYLTENYLYSGSNNKFTTFALANWVGAATESKYPYYTDPGSGNRSRAMDDSVHLTNAYWINPDDHDSIKYYVMKNGVVGISVYMDDAFLNDSYNALYNDQIAGTNHAISIIGWDDTFSASKFLTTAPGNGAWLCRNSWGANWGDNGYFWVSYYDESFNMSGATFFSFEFDNANNYDWNYHHDGSFGTQYIKLNNGTSAAAIYQACGNTNGNEILEAVGIGLASANVDYSLQIYTDLTSSTDPTSGTPAFSKPQTGTTGLAGYHTIPLKEAVTLRNGQTFSVVFTTSSRNQSTVSFFIDYSYDNGGWITFESDAAPGDTFYKYSGGSWADAQDRISGGTAVMRIKAYTSKDDGNPITGLSFPHTSVSVRKGQTYQQMPVTTPANPDAYELTWTSSNTAVAQVSASGCVSTLKAGTATITASARNGKVSATYQVTVLPVVDSIDFTTCPSSMTVGRSSSVQVKVLPRDAADYYDVSLTTSNAGVISISGNTLTAVAPGTAVITAQADGKSVAASITVTWSMHDADVQVEDVIFQGDPVCPDVTVTMNGHTLNPNTDYSLSYRNNTAPGTGIVTITGMGNYSGTVEKNFKIALERPEITSLTTEKTGIRISWKHRSDASSYVIYRKTGTGSWKKIKTVTNPSVTEHLDTGAKSAGILYSYRIMYNYNGSSFRSDYSDVQLIRRMAAPTISTMKFTGNGFRLSWKNVKGAKAYQVYRSANDGSLPEYLGTVTRAKTTNIYADVFPFDVGTIYTYKVVPESTESGQTRTGLTSRGRSAGIPKPVAITGARNTIKGIALTWDTSDQAVSYEIFRSKNGINWSKVKTITSSGTGTWTNTSSLTSGKEYFYRIRTRIKLSGTYFYSEYSEIISLHRLARPSVSSLRKASGGIQVKTSRVAAAHGYEVFRSANGEAAQTVYTSSGSNKALNFIDYDVTSGTRYTYTVVAYVEHNGIRTYSAVSAQKTIRY